MVVTCFIAIEKQIYMLLQIGKVIDGEKFYETPTKS
jgi:hypothetical protein